MMGVERSHKNCGLYDELRMVDVILGLPETFRTGFDGFRKLRTVMLLPCRIWPVSGLVPVLN